MKKTNFFQKTLIILSAVLVLVLISMQSTKNVFADSVTDDVSVIKSTGSGKTAETVAGVNISRGIPAALHAAGRQEKPSTESLLKNEAARQSGILKSLGTNEVKVGTYVLNIRKLDVGSGTWVVDFYLWFIWQGDSVDPGNFEVMNGSTDYKDKPSTDEILITDEVKMEVKKFKWLSYRIVSTISNDLNFKNYPLDVQNLTIEIEDREMNENKLRYITVPEENNVDDHVKIQGWEFKEKFSYVTNHTYLTTFGYEDPGDFPPYSRYIFGLKISRPRFSSLLKVLLPLTIILSLSFLAFAMSPDKLSQRISLGVSTVFTSVAFHINLTSGIPQVSYLTLADRLMISCYFILFMSLISTIYLIKYVDSEQIGRAVEINKRLRILVPFLGISLLVLQFFY